MPDIRRARVLAGIGTTLLLAACADLAPNATETRQSNPEIERLMADARAEMGDGKLAEAGRLYDEALAINPQDPSIWVEIARLRFRGGEHFGAVEAAELALDLDPGFAPALLLRAQMVRDAYGPGEALAWFESALALHPDDVDLIAEYAGTLGDAGRHRDMLDAVRKLAEIDPRDPRVHYLQAVLAARAGDPVLASSLLKRSGMHDAGVPSAMVLRSLIDMQQGNFDNAVTVLEELSERQPGNERVRELLARALWGGGRDRELVEQFAGQASDPSGSPYLSMLVGRSLERLGRREGAIAYIDRASETGQGGIVPLSVRGDNLPQTTAALRRLLNSSRDGEAIRLASDLATNFGGSSDIRVLAGDVALAQGDATEALEFYGEAAQVRRPWPLTKKIIAAYRMAENQDAADALLVRHLEAEPLNTEALVLLAERSASDEDWLRVAVLLDSAIASGAGNDTKLLVLRLQAAEALDEDAAAQRFEAALAQVRPRDFVGR